MRINKWIAGHSSLGRRTVDELIVQGKITINDIPAELGQEVIGTENIKINGKSVISTNRSSITLLLNKPVGVVCSRAGQGSKTIYDLLPKQYKDLKIAGRLDKESSGLVILSNDGNVIQALTHPTLHKKKVYVVTTNKPLSTSNLIQIESTGVDIDDDRPSVFTISPINDQINSYQVELYEGRNRQIRRTIEALGNQVLTLHRIQIGPYTVRDIPEKSFKVFP